MSTFSITDWASVTATVYLAVAQPETVNIAVVFGTKHVLLVDTGSSPVQGAAIADSVQRRFGRTIDRVVVTHAHHDHWFGLAAFAAVKTYAQAQLLETATTGDDAVLAQQLGFSPELITVPQNLIREWGSFNLGGEQVQLKHFGPAHSNSDLVVYLPKQQVAFVGDLLEESGPLQFGPDSTIGTWPGVIDQIVKLVTKNTILIPGHGKPVDVAYALQQRDEISNFYQHVQKLRSSGYGLQEALLQAESDGDQVWPFNISAAREATICAYAELAQPRHTTES
ncbi:MAG: MBL fold metallo-hydrolase [Propionibacteriaceae bacterium]|jgi:glyoxylase-like metal-dependent hydrolase (beta-lactamase superfamily II)|nr:MBL fold metallo-hydrolase [Propionibacteriaceae bacterium]